MIATLMCLQIDHSHFSWPLLLIIKSVAGRSSIVPSLPLTLRPLGRRGSGPKVEKLDTQEHRASQQ